MIMATDVANNLDIPVKILDLKGQCSAMRTGAATQQDPLI